MKEITSSSGTITIDASKVGRYESKFDYKINMDEIAKKWEITIEPSFVKAPPPPLELPKNIVSYKILPTPKSMKLVIELFGTLQMDISEDVEEVFESVLYCKQNLSLVSTQVFLDNVISWTHSHGKTIVEIKLWN